MIEYVTTWKDDDIGGGLNEAIERLPEDAWVCIRDGDTLFLAPDWGKQIAAIVGEAERCNYALVGCMTNRLRANYQCHGGAISDEPDVGKHIEIAQARWTSFGTTIRAWPIGPLAGMFMLFKRSHWKACGGFEERSWRFDKRFTERTRALGAKVGIATGFYLFHLYRWGQPDPANFTGHLICPS